MIQGAGMRRVSQMRIAMASKTMPATSSQAAVAGLAMTAGGETARAGARPCGSSFAKAALAHRRVARKPFQIGVDHQLDKLTERHAPLPTELGLGFRGIADEVVDLRRPQELRVRLHVLLVVESDVAERRLGELQDRVLLASREDEILGLVLLQHHPHALDVVPRVAPVALRVEVAQTQVVSEAELDPRNAVAHLPRHELQATPGRLVVEEDAGDRVKAIRLSV